MYNHPQDSASFPEEQILNFLQVNLQKKSKLLLDEIARPEARFVGLSLSENPTRDDILFGRIISPSASLNTEQSKIP